jgi:NAD(P)-dependent dehydrogenase (short-subunit alcohol dehydrogenase family)
MQFTKVALVTAGSAGLGATIARILASEAEMRVVINYSNNAERAAQLITTCQKFILNTPLETRAF